MCFRNRWLYFYHFVWFNPVHNIYDDHFHFPYISVCFAVNCLSLLLYCLFISGFRSSFIKQIWLTDLDGWEWFATPANRCREWAPFPASIVVDLGTGLPGEMLPCYQPRHLAVSKMVILKWVWEAYRVTKLVPSNPERLIKNTSSNSGCTFQCS